MAKTLKVGVIGEASPGVVVESGAQRLPAEAGMTLNSRNRLSVPVNGHVAIRQDGHAQWRFRAGAVVSFRRAVTRTSPCQPAP